MALPSLFKTPDEYLAVMIDRLRARGSAITDFNIGSGARNVFEAIGTALSMQSAVIDQHRLDSYLSTATGDALTLRAHDNFGVDRKQAIAATGTIRIERTNTAGATTIPAGWSALATLPSPGVASVTYTTTADAVFADGVDVVDVDGKAVVGGVAGNIDQDAGDELPIIPINPYAGFDSATGFRALGPFTGGVDTETDEQLRTRVPLAVQGRVKGKWASFMAAALGVPGITSAQVLQPGDGDVGGGTVAGGQVKVIYAGDISLQDEVEIACADASMLGQNVTVVQATDVRLVADLEVFVQAGTDVALAQANVRIVLHAFILTAGVGNGARFSKAVEAVHSVAEIQSTTIPFEDFRKFSASDGTCADIPATVGGLPDLADADLAVTVTVLS